MSSKTTATTTTCPKDCPLTITITIPTASGKQRVTAHLVNGAPGMVVAEIPLNEPGCVQYSVTHKNTGYAIAPNNTTIKSAKTVARVFWRALSPKDRQLFLVGTNARKFAKECKSGTRAKGLALIRSAELSKRLHDVHWLRVELARYEASNLVDGLVGDCKDESATVTVRNRHTGETREVTLTSDDLINGGTCCGPCECTIEPDSIAGCGWEGRGGAIAYIA
jgi:hypothetical protein